MRKRIYLYMEYTDDIIYTTYCIIQGHLRVDAVSPSGLDVHARIEKREQDIVQSRTENHIR